MKDIMAVTLLIDCENSPLNAKTTYLIRLLNLFELAPHLSAAFPAQLPEIPRYTDIGSVIPVIRSKTRWEQLYILRVKSLPRAKIFIRWKR
jgi:hypothetical protein